MIKRAEEERPQSRKIDERTSLSDPGRGFPPSTVPVTPLPPRTSNPPPVSRPYTTSIPSPTSTSPTHAGQPIQSRKRFSWGRALLVIGLVVLVVVASVGYFSFQTTSQLVAIPNLPYKGHLALDDPLNNSSGYGWSEETYPNVGGSCTL